MKSHYKARGKQLLSNEPHGKPFPDYEKMTTRIKQRCFVQAHPADATAGRDSLADYERMLMMIKGQYFVQESANGSTAKRHPFSSYEHILMHSKK